MLLACSAVNHSVHRDAVGGQAIILVCRAGELMGGHCRTQLHSAHLGNVKHANRSPLEPLTAVRLLQWWQDDHQCPGQARAELGSSKAPPLTFAV